jgi:hypothetical protein
VTAASQLLHAAREVEQWLVRNPGPSTRVVAVFAVLNFGVFIFVPRPAGDLDDLARAGLGLAFTAVLAFEVFWLAGRRRGAS